MKTILRLSLALFTMAMLFTSFAATPARAATGWTLQAVPDKIESIRGQGFLILGAFGNQGTTPCDHGDAIWVAATHPQYDQLYSMAVTALTTGKKIYGYAHACTDFGWHGGTHNEINGAGALFLVR